MIFTQRIDFLLYSFITYSLARHPFRTYSLGNGFSFSSTLDKPTHTYFSSAMSKICNVYQIYHDVSCLYMAGNAKWPTDGLYISRVWRNISSFFALLLCNFLPEQKNTRQNEDVSAVMCVCLGNAFDAI